MARHKKKSTRSSTPRKIVQIASGEISIRTHEISFWLPTTEKRKVVYALTDDGMLWSLDHDGYTGQITLVELPYTCVTQRKQHD